MMNSLDLSSMYSVNVMHTEKHREAYLLALQSCLLPHLPSLVPYTGIDLVNYIRMLEMQQQRILSFKATLDIEQRNVIKPIPVRVNPCIGDRKQLACSIVRINPALQEIGFRHEDSFSAFKAPVKNVTGMLSTTQYGTQLLQPSMAKCANNTYASRPESIIPSQRKYNLSSSSFHKNIMDPKIHCSASSASSSSSSSATSCISLDSSIEDDDASGQEDLPPSKRIRLEVQASNSTPQQLPANDNTLKRTRMRYNSQQVLYLSNEFQLKPFVRGERLDAIASRVGLTRLQVKQWFRNQRVKCRNRERPHGNAKLQKKILKSMIATTTAEVSMPMEEQEDAIESINLMIQPKTLSQQQNGNSDKPNQDKMPMESFRS